VFGVFAERDPTGFGIDGLPCHDRGGDFVQPPLRIDLPG